MTVRDRIGVFISTIAYSYLYAFGYFVVRSLLDSHFFGTENPPKAILLKENQVQHLIKSFLTVGGMVVPTHMFYRVAFEPKFGPNKIVYFFSSFR